MNDIPTTPAAAPTAGPELCGGLAGPKETATPNAWPEMPATSFPEPRRNSYAVRERWREVARMVVLGVRNGVIAQELDLTPGTVSSILRQPETQQYIEELRTMRDENVADVHDRIVSCADNAVNFLEAILSGQEDVSQALKLKAALTILDRAGHPAATKNIHVGLTGHLSAQDIEDMRRRAQASGSMVAQQVEDLTDMTAMSASQVEDLTDTFASSATALNAEENAQ